MTERMLSFYCGFRKLGKYFRPLISDKSRRIICVFSSILQKYQKSMKIFALTLFLLISLSTSKYKIERPQMKTHDQNFAEINCPQGCSLCTNGTGINSQCTSCIPGYSLNIPVCILIYNQPQPSSGIPWWGKLILILGIFLLIPAIVGLVRFLCYRNGPSPTSYRRMQEPQKYAKKIV